MRRDQRSENKKAALLVWPFLYAMKPFPVAFLARRARILIDLTSPGVKSLLLLQQEPPTHEIMKYLLLAVCAVTMLKSIALAAPANVWHLPTTHETQIATTMRDPMYEVKNTNVTIYQGFFKNGGAGGDQNGGQLLYRTIPRGGSPSAWSSVALSFQSNVGLNQYWKASIPSATIAATDVIEYYVKVTFTGASPETTYLYGADAGSQTTTIEATAIAQAFSIRNRPGWVYHANDRTIGSADITLRVRSGYIGSDNSLASRWSTHGAVYFTTDGSTPVGSLGVAGNAQTSAVSMVYAGAVSDASGNGNAMSWEGTLSNIMSSLSIGATLKYRIGLWNAATLEEKFADHGTNGTNNATFFYQNGIIGQPQLTVNGLSANYTTTKIFVDEIAADSVPLNIVFQPGEANIVDAEIFTNLNRRDRAQTDANGDGYADGITGTDGNSLVAGDDTQYYQAHEMTHTGAGVYTLTLPAQKTGAYRLTARWKVAGDSNWRWYTNGAANRRDHAITVSPQDARDIILYEVNVLNIEASGDTFATRSTIEDMHNAPGAPHENNNRWDLDYVNALGANWLWFQPIHPCGFDGREPVNGYGSGSALYDPGSPYAVKNFFEVNPLFSKNFSGNPLNPSDMLNATNRAAAMTAWQNFVAAADEKKIGIMLDAPFNHTAFDCELGQVGVDLLKPDGATWSPSDEIRNRDARFYSLDGNYGNRASSAANIAPGPDRYDFGKWNDVKDVFFGRYDALVENNTSPENASHNSEGDWFEVADADWTSNDFVQGGVAKNTTRQVWQYFARYAVHWLEKTRPAGQNRNSSTEPGLSIAQRYAWDARGIDGNRCDFGQGLPPQAWEYIINVARSYKWNFVMMAESLDGGAVTYRSNRHFDILNENIVFPLQSASNKSSYRDIYESRRNAYGQGLVLANTTSHDEENYTDPWQALLRMGVTASLDGVPMIFPGQELGISRTFGYDHYETNFGKQIAHFKRYNSMMPIWNDANYGNDQLFHVYAGMARARQASRALRSSNRWFLDGDGGNAQIHAVAKYESANVSPAFQDVVLAFANLDRNNAQADQFKIPATLANLLGVKDGRSYNVKNRSAYENAGNGTAGRSAAWLWSGGGLSGAQLKSSGLFISLAKVPTTGTSNAAPGDWASAPFEAQYLKLYDVTAPPAPLPLSAAYVLGNSATITWLSNAGPDDAISHYLVSIGTTQGGNQVIDQAVVPAAQFSYSFTGNIGTVYYASIKAVSAAGVASSVAAMTDAGAPNMASTSSPMILLDPLADNDGDCVSNADEDIAGTNPLLNTSRLAISAIARSGADVVLTFPSIPGRYYRLETSTSLAPNSWSFVSNSIMATSSNSSFTHANGSSDPKRFYRIRVSTTPIF